MNWDKLLYKIGHIERQLEEALAEAEEIYKHWIPYGDPDGEKIDQLLTVLMTITRGGQSASGDICRIAFKRLEERTTQIIKEPEE